MESEKAKALKEMAEENGKKIDTVNKRIDFDRETLNRISALAPLFNVDPEVSQNELISRVIKKSVLLAENAVKIDDEVISLLVGLHDLSKALKCEDEALLKTKEAIRAILKEIVD